MFVCREVVKVRVLIIDDHHLFRSGLKYLLAGLKLNTQFLESGSCDEAILLFDADEIDIVLLDYYLPGQDGLSALNIVREHFDCPVVLISSEDQASVIRNAIAEGAAGYIPKASSPQELVAALKLVLAQGVYLPPGVLGQYELKQWNEESQAKREEILSDLSSRQLAVLMKAVQGKANKVIARELDIAEGTVKSHLFACYKALGVDNRTEAVYATAALALIPAKEFSMSPA